MRLIWPAVFSALFSTLTFGLSFSVHAASFDCAKAATAPEKMICASSTLGALDSAQFLRSKKVAKSCESEPR